MPVATPFRLSPLRLAAFTLLLTLLAAALPGRASAQAPIDTLFYDGFEADSLDAAFWTATSSDPGGLIDVATDIQGFVDIAYRGLQAAVIGRSVDGPFTTNQLDLRLDLSGQTDVELRFALYHVFEETQALDALYFSDDGGTSFVRVYPFNPSGWTGFLWGELPPIDVDRLAAENGLSLTSQFVIRFQQYDDDNFSGCNSCDGFFLDEVVVGVPQVTYAPLPFADSFESGTFGSAWAWRDPRDTGGAATTLPGGLVTVATEVQNLPSLDVSYDGLYGVVMGRRADGPFTTNALDLHLNLANETDVDLQFWIQDRADETQSLDGLWFSDDGGDSFVRVYSLTPQTWSEAWGQLPPIDVDGLAAENGLSLTSRFIIRFQQYGGDDFDSRSGSDGWFIDDVRVTAREVTYATLPFEETFESGALVDAWTWSDPRATAGEASVASGGIVEVVESIQGIFDVGRESPHAVALGRLTDGFGTANALDLHLDLSSESDVELRFWLNDRADETSVLDGLWFSDDGGSTFTRVTGLDPSAQSNSTWVEQPTFDVDALTDFYGLDLTDRFVIRFQQIGAYDFVCNGSRCDGWFIDDVSVTASNSTLSVWPGDANDDGVVNQADVLPIGLYFADRGPARVNASSQWRAQFATPWDANSTSVPRVATYADATGDGVVNQGDVLPIGVNWGRTRPAASARVLAKADRGAVDLRIVERTPTGLVVAVDASAVGGVLGVAGVVAAAPDAWRIDRVTPSDAFGTGAVRHVQVDPAAGTAAFGLSRTPADGPLGGTARLATVELTALHDGADADALGLRDVVASRASGETVRLTANGLAPATPLETGLSALYPNPMTDAVTLEYALAAPGEVALHVYNVLGQRVRTMDLGARPAGRHDVTWDGTSDAGRTVGAGVYFCRLHAGDTHAVRKIVVVR